MNLVFLILQEKLHVAMSGEILTEGTPQQIQADVRVREVYLGEAALG